MAREGCLFSFLRVNPTTIFIPVEDFNRVKELSTYVYVYVYMSVFDGHIHVDITEQFHEQEA